MRTLVDTNVIIHLEDDHILDSRFSDFYREATKNSQLLVHPLSKKEVERDRDERRRSKTLSKLTKYAVLESPPEPGVDFLNSLGPVIDEHDSVDMAMLYAVAKDSVDILVTEDQGIHRKAAIIGVQERVLTVEQAVYFFLQLAHREVPHHILLKHVPIHNLDLSDEFFDSLRADYGEKVFNEWFKKKSRDSRMCWAYIEKGKPLAVCIYKEENAGEVDSKQVITPTLKLCTFKVADVASGKKLGELLLRLAFQYAHKNNLSSVYLTLFPKYESMKALLEDFGFHQVDWKGQEMVMMKQMRKPPTITPGYEILKRYAIDYYPYFFDGPQIQKFIIPIQPKYHDALFPDCSGAQTKILDYSEPNPQGNTIKKAYICNAKTKQIRQGDLLLFYRSDDRREITSIGVVERVMRSSDPSKIAAAMSNRTVYTFEEIKKIAGEEALAIIFRQMEHLNKPVSASILKKKCNIKGPIQSIRKIKEPQYRRIIEEGRMN